MKKWLMFSVMLGTFMPAMAAEVALIGVMGSKAVVRVDGGKEKVMSIGETFNAVKLVSVESGRATFDIDGKRKTVGLGEAPLRIGGGGGSGSKTTLYADETGHFFTTISVNGANMRALVDTGASLVSMSASQARSAGIDYKSGRRGMTQTANGLAPVYVVKLRAVKVNDITLYDVEGSVSEGEHTGGMVLLGMSFLNRLAMQREGTTMTLTQRY
ncbi:retropepsin-like aspartic protease [Chitinivorax sp. B]|uniref:retropepsin-like aspartic protease family protein n=1 Tax=Chitinivorax sp. B TaxID=2502235 RepID=UPI0014856EBC|nr:retropepsin-like aspartic protease [Chitinivorax sp. B]